MKRRILKQKLDKLVISCGKPVVRCETQYLVQEYNEVSNDWETITYNTNFDTISPAVFSNIEIAKLCYLGELGVIKEEEIKTNKINLE